MKSFHLSIYEYIYKAVARPMQGFNIRVLEKYRKDIILFLTICIFNHLIQILFLFAPLS